MSDFARYPDQANRLSYANRLLAPNVMTNISGVDRDAAAYALRSGATAIESINLFVRGVKSAGLWESMVCWPLRSSQNAGTGTTAYSLGGLGTYDGTLVNGPTWGADEISRSATNSIINITSPPQTAGVTFGAVYRTTEISTVTRVPIAWNRMEAAIAGASTADWFSDSGVDYWLQIGAFTNSRNMIALSTNANSGSVTGRTFRNGIFANSGTRSLVSTRLTAAILNFPAGNLAVTHASFAFMANAQWSDAQVAAFYALYRNTLGQGLGLP